MLDKIIAVASGKGGVGKSTIAVNLACALPLIRPGIKVALVDLDFYGPSIPLMMGGGNVGQDEQRKINPAQNWGIKYLSIAFFMKQGDQAIIWRGPMFSKAIRQFFFEVNWGDIDICLVDLPPGTGDAQISLSQLVKLSGAVMVTTPQMAAVSDVRRAINMFLKVNVPVLGLVENMSGLIGTSGEQIDIFGSGGGGILSNEFGVPLWGSIPLDAQICSGGDCGKPIVLDEQAICRNHFLELARKLSEQLRI